jgi:hypothetical protein
MMRAVASCCGDVAADEACQRCALLIDTARTLMASETPAPSRRLVGYRVGVAAREDHRTPPPRGHRDWLRVTRPQSPGFEGLAEQRNVGAGFLFLTRRAAQWEADAWAEHWHARVITVWRVEFRRREEIR